MSSERKVSARLFDDLRLEVGRLRTRGRDGRRCGSISSTSSHLVDTVKTESAVKKASLVKEVYDVR